jgi:hypothetical protein
MHFWKLVLKRCGQLFHTKHLAVQHYVGELYFLLFIGGAMVECAASTNAKDLNYCHDSCARITKVEIYVT